MAHRLLPASVLVLMLLLPACNDDSSPTTITTVTTTLPAAPAPVAPPPTAPPPLGNRPPVPSFKVTPFPPEGNAPLAVNFNLCPTADPDGDRILFVFDFGDGVTLQGPPCRFLHTYAAGRYTAKMCLWDFRPEHSLDCVLYTVKAQ
jgi:hypothetical protein